MMAACYDKASPTYQFNGRLGVTVCKQWKEFFGFLTALGPMPGYLSVLDRVPGTHEFNSKTTEWRRGRERQLLYGSVIRTVNQWSAQLGIPVGTITSRIRKNLPTHQVLSKNALPRFNRVGKRFGMLTVIQPVPSVFKYEMVKVKCDCGSSFKVAYFMLQNKIRSCGCVPGAEVKACPDVIVYAGKTKNLRQWQAICGVPAKIIAARIRAGFNMEQALGYEEIPERATGARHLSRLTGVKESTIRHRRNIGVHPDEVTRVESLDKSTLYTLDGITMSLSQWAAFLDINVATLRSRLYRGWSVEETLRIPDGNSSSY